MKKFSNYKFPDALLGTGEDHSWQDSMTEFDIEPAEVRQWITEAQKIVFFTGAGISAESGISTFRDPQTGALWSKFDPETMSTMKGFQANPQLVWDWNRALRAQVVAASPNAAHLAIGELSKTKEVTVVTQNVDDLHERGGASNVLHLHGSLEKVSCTLCDFDDMFTELVQTTEDQLPACPKCGGLCRPKVVWFGEQLPRAEFTRAMELIKSCDLLIVIGTSAQVEPAASMPGFGPFDRVVSINTRLSDHHRFAHKLTGKAGEILSQLIV